MPFSTQQHIEIAGIKDGVVILKNDGYRIVMSVSTVNFALKSEQEQNSLIFQYQSFLNSLHFPIQIVMRSKRLDLTPYLAKVVGLAQKQENELLRIQTEDYIDFVTKLIDLANIMKKNFFVVVPYQPVTLQSPSFLGKLFNKEKTVSELRISEDEFKHNAESLRQRAQVVANGLAGMGLHCTQLSTEEIIELFYQIYNPEVATKERVEDAGNLSSTVIEHASEKESDAKIEEGRPKDEEPPAIDNSETVAEVQKEQAALRQQEMLKTGTRQIGMTPAQGTAPKAEEKAESPKEPTEQSQAAEDSKIPVGQNSETGKQAEPPQQ